MRQLTKTTFFALVSNVSGIENSEEVETELETAFDNFATEVIAVVASGQSYQSLFRTLRYTRVHLQALRDAAVATYEAEKKCVQTTHLYQYRHRAVRYGNRADEFCFERGVRADCRIGRVCVDG